MPGTIPNNPLLYRIVHWQNVEYVLRHGMFTRGHEQADPNYVEIGHTRLIGQRHTHPIPDYDDQGNLGDCVPFYFGPHSPMLYAILKGSNGVQLRQQDEIVYLITSVDTIIEHELTFFFTDRHAKAALANGYNKKAKLKNIDWDIVLAKYWNNTTNDMDRRDRKQAEFLVLNEVPPTCIEEIKVKTAARQTQIRAILRRLRKTIPVTLDTTVYF